jgi:hypothetical protein
VCKYITILKRHLEVWRPGGGISVRGMNNSGGGGNGMDNDEESMGGGVRKSRRGLEVGYL